jgi:chromosome segregation ATPase
MQLHDKLLAMNDENSLMEKQVASLASTEDSLRGKRAILCDSLTSLVEELDNACKATIKRDKENARTKTSQITAEAMETSKEVKVMSTTYTSISIENNGLRARLAQQKKTLAITTSQLKASQTDKDQAAHKCEAEQRQWAAQVADQEDTLSDLQAIVQTLEELLKRLASRKEAAQSGILKAEQKARMREMAANRQPAFVPASSVPMVYGGNNRGSKAAKPKEKPKKRKAGGSLVPPAMRGQTTTSLPAMPPAMRYSSPYTSGYFTDSDEDFV